MTDEWEHCPRSCGTLGFQIRTVRCVQFLHDGTNRSVHSKYCSSEKPESRRPCNRVSCPAQWRTGAWSEVGHPHLKAVVDGTLSKWGRKKSAKVMKSCPLSKDLHPFLLLLCGSWIIAFQANCLADIFIWSQSVFVRRKWKTSLIAGSWV